MPSVEAPGLSSSRIQRALRLNGIEDGRLLHTVHILDNEKRRSLRLMNQDKRLACNTMDSIHASSGVSQEGLPPEITALQVEDDYVEPCFVYGDRVRSRRFGKFRRSKSASVLHGRKEQPRLSTGDVLSARDGSSIRPHSSPGGRQTAGQTPGNSALISMVMEANTERRAGSNKLDSSSHDGTVTGSRTKIRASSARASTAPAFGTRDPVPGYSGPPILTPLRSSPPGFSRAGQNKQEEKEEDELSDGIRKSIARVSAQAALDADINEMVARIRNSKTGGNTEQSLADARASAIQKKLLHRLPMEQIWSGRSASPAKQLELLNLKKNFQSTSQKQLDNKLHTFLGKFRH